MRLLFVDNLLLAEKGDFTGLDLHPHLGLLSLVAVAEAAGYHADIYDPKRAVVNEGVPYDGSLYRELARRIAERRPDVIGFTTLGCSFICVVKVATHLRKLLPGVPILLGGPHATILHQDILERFSVFDVVVRHEAEYTLVPVIEALSTGQFDGIPGITYRSRGVVRFNAGAPTVDDLDSLPMPAYDRYPLQDLGIQTVRVDAGRGCPFHCTFCSTASFFGRRYRLKSPERLVQELDHLNKRFSFTSFGLNHDLFTVDKRKVRAFCEAVRGRGYTWSCSARMDCVNAELLHAMWEAGCRRIFFGVETGSRRMQQIAKKRMNLDLVEPTLDATERLQMKAIVSFITGYPEENQADQNDTLDMIGACFRRDRRFVVTQLHMLTPEPGTELYTEYRDRMQYDGYITDFNAWTLEPDDAELMKCHPEIFVTHHFYPTVLPRERHVFTAEAYRVLRTTGHEIVEYLLRFYEGRLSKLIAKMYLWAGEQGRTDSPPDRDLVLAFLSADFGDEHHVVSLFRYALETVGVAAVLREAENRALVHPAAPTPNPEVRYVLNPLAFLFSNIHDCALLLALIRQNRGQLETLDDSMTGERGPLLIVFSGNGGALQNYLLDAATHAVLNMFRKPLSYAECCGQLMAVDVHDVLDWESIAEMAQLGVLVPSSEIRNRRSELQPVPAQRSVAVVPRVNMSSM